MTPTWTDDKFGVTLYHADCLDVLPTLGKVDAVVTDPPYGEHTHNKQWIAMALSDGDKRVSTAHSELGFDPLSADVQARVCLMMADQVSRWSLAFTDIEGIEGWRAAATSCGLEYVRTCIWDKVDSAPQFTGDRPAASAEAIVVFHQPGKKRWNGGGRRNVFRYAINQLNGPKPHPSTKPLPLMYDLTGLFTDPGELILDPFMGSGTTGVAAVNLCRKFIGIEKERKYFDIAVERIRQAIIDKQDGPLFAEHIPAQGTLL